MTDHRFRLAQALRRLNEEIATSSADESVAAEAADLVEYLSSRK